MSPKKPLDKRNLQLKKGSSGVRRWQKVDQTPASVKTTPASNPVTLPASVKERIAASSNKPGIDYTKLAQAAKRQKQQTRHTESAKPVTVKTTPLTGKTRTLVTQRQTIIGGVHGMLSAAAAGDRAAQTNIQNMFAQRGVAVSF